MQEQPLTLSVNTSKIASYTKESTMELFALSIGLVLVLMTAFIADQLFSLFS